MRFLRTLDKVFAYVGYGFLYVRYGFAYIGYSFCVRYTDFAYVYGFGLHVVGIDYRNTLPVEYYYCTL